jgi:hypothetical protein
VFSRPSQCINDNLHQAGSSTTSSAAHPVVSLEPLVAVVDEVAVRVDLSDVGVGNNRLQDCTSIQTDEECKHIE